TLFSGVAGTTKLGCTGELYSVLHGRRGELRGSHSIIMKTKLGICLCCLACLLFLISVWALVVFLDLGHAPVEKMPYLHGKTVDHIRKEKGPPDFFEEFFSDV